MSAFAPGAFSVTPYALPVALTGVLILAFGARLLARRFTSVSAAFFSMTLAAAIWLAAFTAMYSTSDAGLALVCSRLAYLGVPFLAPAVYWFTIEFLRIERSRRFLVVAAWILGGFFSALAVTTDRLIPAVQQYWWGFYPRYSVGMGAAFLTFFFGFLVLALFEYVRAFPRAQGDERKRIRLLIVAFGIAYLGCVDYLPKYGVETYPFGYVPILGFVFVVAHAVRMYDLVPITPSLAAREIIGTMADTLFVCGRDGRIEFANRAAGLLLGYDEAELAGRRIDDLLVEEGNRLSVKLHRRSLRNDEYVFATKSGDRVDLTLSIAPVIHDGQSAGAVIIGRDIRDRKRAEREVLQAVTLLQSTLDSTADGILVIGEGGRIVSYNHRFLDMWRVPPRSSRAPTTGRCCGACSIR
jgi:PAS domain S-box-containing protein